MRSGNPGAHRQDRVRLALSSDDQVGRWIVVLAFAASLGATGSAVRLLDAVKAGNREAARVLLKQGAEVNVREADGSTALHWAVRGDDLEMVALLIRARADVRASNRYGITPLSVAAGNGSAMMIDALIRAGANPNDTRPEGETVLMTAARTGKADAVKVLLDHGADVKARESWYGQTALMWAAAQNHPAVVHALLEAGADVNARSDVLDGTPKRDVVDNRTDKNGLSLEALLTTFPRGGLTPLLLAARQGALDAALVLVAAGADVNQSNPDGISPLVLAIRNGHYDVAALLIDKGADLDAADTSGRTALYAAVDMHSLDWIQNRPSPKPSGALDSLAVVKLLLGHGANPNVQLRSTPPPWKGDAVGPGNIFANVIGPGTTPFIRAAKNADLAVMHALLDKGVDPNLATSNRATALMALVGGLGRKYGADMHVTPEEERNAIEGITLCLNLGIDINAANDAGQTALHGAAMLGTNAIVQFLADRGARLDVKNNVGRTPAAEALNGVINNDGAPGESHQSTAALLGELIATRDASAR